MLIANIGSGMGSQLAAARLLYGMGRSDGIPKSFFGAIDPKNRIPRNNMIFVGAIALMGAFLISYERGAELLNFGAFIAFMGVNAAAFVRYYLRAPEKRWPNRFPRTGFCHLLPDLAKSEPFCADCRCCLDGGWNRVRSRKDAGASRRSWCNSKFRLTTHKTGINPVLA